MVACVVQGSSLSFFQQEIQAISATKDQLKNENCVPYNSQQTSEEFSMTSNKSHILSTAQ